MSKHIQFDANMSLSGANADKRVPLKVAEQKLALVKIYKIVTGSSVNVAITFADFEVVNVSLHIKFAGSCGVLVSGNDYVNAQLLVFAINQELGSAAFDSAKPKYVRGGNVKEMNQLVKDMNAGNVSVLIMSGVNPVYSLYNGNAFVEGLKKVKTSVAFTLREDETASLTTIAAAAPHYLESWCYDQKKKGHYSIVQPTIRPLFNTKQFQEGIMTWIGKTEEYYDYLKSVAGSL